MHKERPMAIFDKDCGLNLLKGAQEAGVALSGNFEPTGTNSRYN